MAQVMIPTPLRTYTRGQKTVTVAGATVDDALSALTTAYPDLKRHLFNDQGKLRNFVNIYLGENDVRYLDEVRRPFTSTTRSASCRPSQAERRVIERLTTLHCGRTRRLSFCCSCWPLSPMPNGWWRLSRR